MHLSAKTKLHRALAISLICLLWAPLPLKAQPVETEILSCPVTQKQVKNGAKPDAELFKKIVRCKKGDEGAVRVVVTALQIGSSRPWSYRQDSGNGQAGTMVYPVKASYTVNTFYRAATEIDEGWIRILNFSVNPFGEWEIGSKEPVKSPTTKRVPK